MRYVAALPPQQDSQDPEPRSGLRHVGSRGGNGFSKAPLERNRRQLRYARIVAALDAYDARRAKGAPQFRCKPCQKDFTITSGTLFASHKLPLRAYLAAIAIFCNEVKGKSHAGDVA